MNTKIREAWDVFRDRCFASEAYTRGANNYGLLLGFINDENKWKNTSFPFDEEDRPLYEALAKGHGLFLKVHKFTGRSGVEHCSAEFVRTAAEVPPKREGHEQQEGTENAIQARAPEGQAVWVASRT